MYEPCPDHREHRSEQDHVAPSRRGDGAHHPPERIARDIGGGGGHDHHDRGIGERAHDHPRHQEQARVAQSSGGVGDGEDRRNGAERADEGRQRDERRRANARRHGNDGANGGPPRHTQQIRFGQRVAQRSLQDAATHPQRRTHQHRQQHARQANRAHDGDRGRIAPVTDERPPDIGRCNVRRPQHEGCLLYTSPSPRDRTRSRMPSSA